MLAVFTRTPLDEDAFAWLRLFANHAAVAIVAVPAHMVTDLKRAWYDPSLT